MSCIHCDQPLTDDDPGTSIFQNRYRSYTRIGAIHDNCYRPYIAERRRQRERIFKIIDKVLLVAFLVGSFLFFLR